MLEKYRLSISSRPIEVFRHWNEEGYLNLNAPYQRGDVWGIERSRNLIKSLLLGIPIPSVIVNDRFAAGWGGGTSDMVVIDGKQRITTFLMFLDGQLLIPSEWVENSCKRSLVGFDYLDKSMQRRIRHSIIPVVEGQLESLEEEIEVFNLVNYGGVPQGETDV